MVTWFDLAQADDSKIVRGVADTYLGEDGK
jgi:hypothetical protein